MNVGKYSSRNQDITGIKIKVEIITILLTTIMILETGMTVDTIVCRIDQVIPKIIRGTTDITIRGKITVLTKADIKKEICVKVKDITIYMSSQNIQTALNIRMP